MHKKETVKAKIGRIGETVACEFLMKRGFAILGRNYRKKWGEIDIIARKNGIIRFVEVKTVSRENINSISHENDGYFPEENVHPWKLKRLYRAIESYLSEKKLEENEWQLDVLAIFLDKKDRKARARFTENVL